MEKRVLRIALWAVVISSLNFIVRGYLRPLARALTKIESHSDLRGPYFGALDLRLGSNPYAQPDILPSASTLQKYGISRMKTGYSPQALIFYMPLTFLTFPAAKAIWLSLNFILVCFFIWLLYQFDFLLRTKMGLLFIIFLVTNFFPLIRSLDMGQNSIPILFILSLGIVALNLGKDVTAGTLLAIATFFKPFPGIIFMGLLLKRRWIPLLTGILVVFCSLMLTMMLFGHDVYFDFLKETYWRSVKVDTWWANQSLQALWMRIFTINSESQPWISVPILAWILWGSCASTIFVLSCLVTLRFTEASLVGNLSLWLVTGLLISPRAIDHYCIWLLIPVVTAFKFFINKNWRLMFLTSIAYGCLAYPGSYWKDFTSFHHGALLLLTSSQTWGMLLLYGILIYVNRFSTSECLSLRFK